MDKELQKEMEAFKGESKSKRMNSPTFMYSVVRKVGSDEVMEIQKIDIKTQKKETIFQHKDYKKLKEKI